jgi:UDP-N-acetylmuramyl pentapeptide phosphotransferase/UDP-N-acetylglucosamine-1-phosphate transferase
MAYRPRDKQIEFPVEQSHHALATPVSLGLAILCIVIVVVLLLADVEGPFIGPW